MTEEEKQLLLKDLCGRLPYRPKGVKLNTPFDPKGITIVGYTGRFVETVDDEIEVERVRLYLRPASSMTEEEKEEFISFNGTDGCYIKTVDFCNKHHLDNRGLIPMGLAFEAPDGMYKTN